MTLNLTAPHGKLRGDGLTTLRRDLHGAGFQQGSVLLQGVGFVDDGHEVMDAEFANWYGTYEAPRIIASDSWFLYIYSGYDGQSRMHRIAKDISRYLLDGNDIPFLGG